MGQYQLWLNHREIDQNLRRKHIAYTQELAKIDEHIARIENTAMQKNNALLTALMQQLKLQEHTSNQAIDTGDTQPEHNGLTQTSPNSQIDPEFQTNGQASLPWWLRDLMQITYEEQEPQPMTPIDQQSIQTNQHVERWFMRRTKLVHYNEWQEGQKK